MSFSMDGNKVTAEEEIQGILPNISSDNDLIQELSLAKETACGLWFIKGKFLQKFANKKAYVLLYGILGCVFSAAYAYFNGTITTMEKRFKISSRTAGVISVGNDVSQLLVSAILSYYAGRGHRPRWMAFGMYTVVLFCLITALPHYLYGAGEDALSLTEENKNSNNYSTYTNMFPLQKAEKQVCNSKHTSVNLCEYEEENSSPQLILFLAQFISGIGGSLYYTLGVSYMDDNIKKSKTPVLLSFTYFIRMLGPTLGYGLASICLKYYISPTLTPTIDIHHPRWLGAWWLGWLILAVVIFIFATLLAMFPKQLPRAAVRKELLKRHISRQPSVRSSMRQETELPTSFNDMIKTFRRVMKNPILMMNNFAAVFYFLGYMPYWIFLPKYMETQYMQSASDSSLITGSVGLVFSGIGILLSGVVISKYKPKARKLAAWNILVGIISVTGIVSYAYLGCSDIDHNISLFSKDKMSPISECNSNCHCDYMRYNPVCSQDGRTTYISACHAGCRHASRINGSNLFSDCTCISKNETVSSERITEIEEALRKEFRDGKSKGGFALPGRCQVDCFTEFYIFLCVVCLLKFSGATGRASNFLLTVRCVEEKDKSVAMGFGLMLMSLCAFVPSPILFGTILDKACLFWSKGCTSTGNCWLYNGILLRYTMNFTAATFVFIGVLFDVGVWYFVRDLQIFEEQIELQLQETIK
ncbi:unnamed protein product [Phyllotreta striolata]|uniref:Solute carrier organic anion transporter family member n=1 Tax=Phyllotreta striolata TaxID=444603 RepID=A0A9N9TG57_PHYSR|nr:unnamed protein product [Phyllotreta striolata]